MPTINVSDAVYVQLSDRAKRSGLPIAQILAEHFLEPPTAAPSDQGAVFRVIFDNALDAIILADDSGTYIDANPAAYQMLNYSKDELIGKSIADISPQEDVTEGLSLWEQFSDDGRQSGEIRLKKRDGTVITVRYNAIVDIVSGTHLSIMQDITDRQRRDIEMRDSEAHYRTIAENFPNGLLALYDHDLRYTAINGQGLAEIGMTPADFNGKRLRDVFPPDIYERDEPALLAALKGETTESVLPFGDDFFRVTTLPVRDKAGNIIAGMVMSQKISAHVVAENQLRDVVQQLELAIKTANLGVWQLDLSSGDVQWNDELHQIMGITREELAANKNSWRDRIHPEDRDNANAQLDKIVTEGAVYDVRFRVVRPDGEIRYIDASGVALTDDAGNVTRLIGINQDITDYEKARQALINSEARYKALFNGSPNPVVVYDENARIVMINDVAAGGLGLPKEAIIGRPLGDFVPQNQQITEQRVQQVLNTREAIVVEDHLTLPDGDHWYLSVVQPIVDDDGNARHAQIISHEITDRKHAELLEIEREQLMKDLEREQTIAQMRSHLISIISHEFRTPLTIIMSASEMLSKYGDRLDAEKRDERIKSISDQVLTLDQMITEVSTLSRANRGVLDYNPQPTNLESLCKSLLDSLHDTANTTNHRLHFVNEADASYATLDQKLVHRALTNLLSNAMKYSPQGGDVILTVTRTDSMWEFSVSDEGIGIPPEDEPGMFQPFSRASNVGTIRGTGLGLSIVKEVAEYHGGTVRFNSTVDKGSTFYITIPIPPRQ